MPTSVSRSIVRLRASSFAHPPVQLQNLADLLFNRVQRIERGHRLLKYHRDVIAAHASQISFVAIEQILTLEQHLAGRMARRRIWQQLEHGECGNRFARSRLADQRDRFARTDIKGDMVDGQCLLLTLAEQDGKVANGKKFMRAHENVFRGSNASRVASPTKISSESISEMTKKPVRPSQGDLRLF